MIIIIVGVVAVATEPYYMTPAIREKKREWVEYLFSNKTNQTLHVHRSSVEAMKKNNIWWLSEGASQSERAQHLTQSSKRTQTHTDFFLTTQFEWTKTPAPWFSDFPSPTHKQNKTEHTTSHTNAQTFAYIFLNLLREKERQRASVYTIHIFDCYNWRAWNIEFKSKES